MYALTALAAFSPLLLSASVILGLRRSAAVGAMSGIVLAVALSLIFEEFTADGARLKVAATSALVLTLSAVIVIVPGLYLNAVLRGQGVVDGLAVWIQSLRLDAERKVLVLLLGPLPAVESLTGFGVSLFLAVPIFFRLVDAGPAYRLSLLSMNIMPWGTLALATVIAANLSGLPLAQLGAMTALTSALVFPCVGAIALSVLGGASLVWRHGLLAALLGFGLSGLLFVLSAAALTETAGILAGSAIGALGFALLRPTADSEETPALNRDAGRPHVLRLLLPYALVLALILLSRIPIAHDWLAGAWVLHSSRMRFSVFTSPGWALIVVALVLLRLRSVPIDHRAVWSRAKTATLGIFCFVLLAQLMLESGMIDAIAAPIERAGAGRAALLCVLSPLLGAVSGFTTGSNVGGNALLIVMQHRVGEAAGHGLLFTASQNSAAGHAVFASLPIIILVMTIARDTAHDAQVAEHDLLRFALKALAFILLALIGACVLIHVLSLSDAVQ